MPWATKARHRSPPALRAHTTICGGAAGRNRDPRKPWTPQGPILLPVQTREQPGQHLPFPANLGPSVPAIPSLLLELSPAALGRSETSPPTLQHLREHHNQLTTSSRPAQLKVPVPSSSPSPPLTRILTLKPFPSPTTRVLESLPGAGLLAQAPRHTQDARPAPRETAREQKSATGMAGKARGQAAGHATGTN